MELYRDPSRRGWKFGALVASAFEERRGRKPSLAQLVNLVRAPRPRDGQRVRKLAPFCSTLCDGGKYHENYVVDPMEEEVAASVI